MENDLKKSGLKILLAGASILAGCQSAPSYVSPLDSMATAKAQEAGGTFTAETTAQPQQTPNSISDNPVIPGIGANGESVKCITVTIGDTLYELQARLPLFRSPQPKIVYLHRLNGEAVAYPDKDLNPIIYPGEILCNAPLAPFSEDDF